MNEEKLRRRLRRLMETQRLAVVATIGRGHPHTNLVAFASTADLKRLVFATLRSTRKYKNLIRHPTVSMLVDDRGNSPSDIAAAVTASAIGRASEPRSGRKGLERLFLEKHPYLAGFVASPDCALICVRPSRYIFVSRFQEVAVITP